MKIGIIGGSGFQNPSFFQLTKETELSTPFGNPSDVFRLGKVGDVECVLISRHGPGHTIPPTFVNYRANLWGLKELGCTHIIATTACGSLQEEYRPGDLVVIDSFIDRTVRRETTFFDGKNLTSETSGVCHIPMEPAFCSRLCDLVYETGKSAGKNIHPKATVVTIEGPRFSTISESRLFHSWGANLVNMTTVPEATLAKELGLLYVAIGLVTDYDCWNDTGRVSAHEVLRCFKENLEHMAFLVKKTVEKLSTMDWSEDIDSAKKLVKSSIV
ncbi:hypothetical protein J437_LFUL006786 [Ladona fulva]|uniref:S-methyl-5'-thioadenosine phosphorylase n=1 Tax=Ladona fulva TaxID=123851 RepID=A0A8K0JUA5_LADFU|nr:hypothetical protein J437_LFUL006786 [Ladona fulva]